MANTFTGESPSRFGGAPFTQVVNSANVKAGDTYTYTSKSGKTSTRPILAVMPIDKTKAYVWVGAGSGTSKTIADLTKAQLTELVMLDGDARKAKLAEWGLA